MGKLKRGKKNQKARHNPLVNKTNDSDNRKDEATRKSKILPLIQKLLSSSPNDRSMALSAITVLCEDNRMRQMLLKERLVPIIMEQCLNDNNDELVVEAFGLLRNIAIDEGYDIIKYCWRSNIWVTIESCLNKIQQSFKYLQEGEAPKDQTKKQKDDEKSKQQLLYDFTEHILSLIVVIASGSEDLYESVLTKLDPVLEFVIDLINFNLKSSKLTVKLYNTLLDFIYEFCSESDEFVKQLQTSAFSLDQVYEFTKSDTQTSNTLGNCYVEGIKFHINEVLNLNTNKNEVALNILTGLFQNVSTMDLDVIKSKLMPQDNANEPIQNNKDIDQQIGGFSEERESAKVDLQSIEIIVDLTTSIFEYMAINDNFEEPVVLSQDVVDYIFKVVLPSICELVKFSEENKGIILLTDKLIVCLNNLSWLFLSLEALPVEWFTASNDLWDLVISVSKTDDEITQKDCLSVLWAIVKSQGPEIKSRISIEMINQLITKCDQFTKNTEQNIDNGDNFEYYLSILGFVGSIAPIIDNTPITYQISEFLLKTIEIYCQANNNRANPTAIELVLESINLLFDIFGDKAYPYDQEIYVQQNYNNKLKLLEPHVKELYKKIDKNKYKALKVKGEEAWSNLGRFIQYKQNE